MAQGPHPGFLQLPLREVCWVLVASRRGGYKLHRVALSNVDVYIQHQRLIDGLGPAPSVRTAFLFLSIDAQSGDPVALTEPHLSFI